jgi:hypothetical protein
VEVLALLGIAKALVVVAQVQLALLVVEPILAVLVVLVLLVP